MAKIQPNEIGDIPVLEYHDIGNFKPPMGRSIARFRKDLERLYNDNYRPIKMKDFLDNPISLPPGKSPVILTFDDARESQFKYRSDGTIDPNCAIGIMEAFAKKHPDFPPIATFFVLPDNAFNQKATKVKKYKYLLKIGSEIANHTVTHRKFHRLSENEIKKEIALCTAKVQKDVPECPMETLALPGGHEPKNKSLLPEGKFQNWKYKNRAVFLAGWSPTPPPISKNYHPMRLERILCVESDMGFTYWMDKLKIEKGRKYVSDGNPDTITIPKTLIAKVNQSQLAHFGNQKLMLYDPQKKEMLADTKTAPKPETKAKPLETIVTPTEIATKPH